MVTLHTCIYVFIHSSNILYVCIALYDCSYKNSDVVKLESGIKILVKYLTTFKDGGQ